QRHRVLAPDVGEDRELYAEQAAVAQCAVRVGVHETLVGQHGAGVDVDTDEAGAHGAGDGERGTGVVLEDVDTQRGLRDRAADLGGQHGEAGDGGGLHAGGRERRVTGVLEGQGGHAVVHEGARVTDGSGDEALHGAVPERAAGQWAGVNHSDEAHASDDCSTRQSVDSATTARL